MAAGNWGWRYLSDSLTDNIADELKALSILFGRHEEDVAAATVNDDTVVTAAEVDNDKEKEVMADA